MGGSSPGEGGAVEATKARGKQGGPAGIWGGARWSYRQGGGGRHLQLQGCEGEHGGHTHKGISLPVAVRMIETCCLHSAPMPGQ